MDDRFRSYSFVDRIASVDPSKRIEGSYAIPEGLPSFPMPLVAEATGQLAAWAAGQALDFRFQPVAGIAGRIEILSNVSPGQTLDLEVDIERVDEEAISYLGTARVDGEPVLRLFDCLGPMIGMDQFDDPDRVRSRYELLLGDGAEPGGFPGIPHIGLTRTGGEEGEWVSAGFTVPQSAPFFGDHFPLRPVFPGTLMLDVHMRLGLELVNETFPPADGLRWTIPSMTRMKMRAFIPPGSELETMIHFHRRDGETPEVQVNTRREKRSISGGRATFAIEEIPS